MVLENEVDNMNNMRNFLINLQIGYKNRLPFIKIYNTQNNINILHFFFKKGWIKHYIIKEEKIWVYLRYIKNKPLFEKILLISKPGFRKYVNIKSLKFFKKNNSRSLFTILYTTYGFLTLKDALNLNVGGEIICMLII